MSARITIATVVITTFWLVSLGHAQDQCSDVLRYGISQNTTNISRSDFLTKRSWVCQEQSKREERFKNVAAQANIPIRKLIVGGSGSYSSNDVTDFLNRYCSSDETQQQTALQFFNNARSAQPEAIAAWDNCMEPTSGAIVAGLRLLSQDNSVFQLTVRYGPTAVAQQVLFTLSPSGITNASCVDVGGQQGPEYKVGFGRVEFKCQKTDTSLEASVILGSSQIEFSRPKPASFIVAGVPRSSCLIPDNVEGGVSRVDSSGGCLPKGWVDLADPGKAKLKIALAATTIGSNPKLAVVRVIDDSGERTVGVNFGQTTRISTLCERAINITVFDPRTLEEYKDEAPGVLHCTVGYRVSESGR